MSATLQSLFQLKCILKSRKIRLSAVSPVSDRQLIALVLSTGSIVLYHMTQGQEDHQVRWLPWFSDAKKEVQSLVFDPVSGGWLLLACYDGSLQIVPTLSLFGQKVDNLLYDWSLDDITSIPVHLNSSNGNHVEFHPTALSWWVRKTADLDRQDRDIAIVGAKCGTVILVSLRTGNIVGTTVFNSCISSLAVCRSEEASEGNTVILLVTGECQQQWKVVLEHHESSSFWPFHYESKSSSDLNLPSSSGLGTEDPQQATKLSVPTFPSARLRLQGLKQLSVEKLASLRQRLSDGRSRSFNNPPNIKVRGGVTVEDSLTRFRSSVDVSDISGSTNNSGISSVVGSGSGPRILSMSNTYLRAQQVQSRTFLTGYYAPADLLTVYVAAIDMNPVSVHKLCVPSHILLLTDWLIYCTDSSGSKLSIISCRLSECQVTQDKHLLNCEPSMDSLVSVFELPSDEFILALYRIPAIRQENGCSTNSTNSHKSPHKSKRSYKTMGRGHIELHCSELCAVVTTRGVYVITIRPIHEEVLACVKDSRRLEDGEKLCRIFALDLQKLLEIAADQQLESGLLESGMELYNLSKCRPLKSVLRLAAAGYTQELLPYATLLLKTADLSPSEQLHLSNLSLLSYTEQTLRAKEPERTLLIKKFKEFLSDNMQYDEELAVNVVAQSGLCKVLIHLANYRGLHPHVADVLARLLTHYHNQSHGIDLQLTDCFWECLSDDLLCESYLLNPDIAHIHLDFVKCKLPTLSQDILECFVAAYDPSRSSLRPILHKFVKRILSLNDNGEHTIQPSYNIETVQGNEETYTFQEWLTTYFMACLYLAQKRAASSLSTSSSSTSLIAVKTDPLTSPEKAEKTIAPVSSTSKGAVLSAGFAHVGLVRNRQLITWGQTSCGCLGVGPNLNRTGNPTALPLFQNLCVTVYSVSCGRMHTLALTDNGVYSWGSSKYGQLGVGKIGQCPQPQLVTRLANERVSIVEAGQYHSMAITSDGKLWTWGWGVHGQLGHGNVEDQHWPVLVNSLLNEVCISCSGGHAHSLVLTASGCVWAFGSSVFGQLGTGSNVKSSRPVQVFGLPEQIIMIATAYFHNLALAASNRLYTWGSSPQVLRLQAQAQKRARFKMQQMQSQSETGSSSDTNCADYNINSAPSSISNDNDDFDDDSEGKGLKTHFKMVPTSRFVTLNSEAVSPSTEMKALPTGRSLNEISESPSFSLDSGTVVNNAVSLAGLDDGLAHLSPTLVDTSHVVGKVTAISCGCHHSALLTDAGKVHTWGRNLDGQLGNGARTKEALHPTQISIGGPVSVDLKHLVCGGEFTLGMEASGKVWAWGSNQYGQLGRTPIEDSTKAGMVLLKTSKRIIKLPHGSLNTADSAKEITGLPPVEVYDLEKKENVTYFSDLLPLSSLEKPAHGLKTLHYALQYFNGLYNLQGLLDKCIELEDWQTAAKLYVLKEQYDQALRYQLKAAFVKINSNILSSASESPSSIIDKKFPSNKPDNQENDNTTSVSKVTDSSLTISAIDLSSTVNMNAQNLQRQESATTIEEEDEDEDDQQKISLIQSGESSDCPTIQNLTTTTSSVDDKMTIVDDSSMDELTTSTEDQSTTSEIHTFAVQGGTEEMSTHSQDTIKTTDSRSVSDDTIDSRSETPDTLNLSSYCEDVLKLCNDHTTDHKSKLKSGSLIGMMKQKSEDSESTCRDVIINKDYGRNNKDVSTKDLLVDYTSVENAYNATVDNYIKIIEYYILHCKHHPVNILRDLLYQALNFWLEQALPVSSLESFLKVHWDIVHYPLGILLFGQDPADKSIESEKILCRLSTEFSILLCSSMVEHVSDKSRPCPEMMDILAGLSWTSDSAGMTTTDQSGRQTSVSTERHLNENEETRLMNVLDELRSPQGTQPYIDIKFSANNSDELTSPQTGEIIAFTCGHRYDGNTSLEKAALGAAHSLNQSALPNTANALHTIFQQPQLVRHFACPTCILGCIESELI